LLLKLYSSSPSAAIFLGFLILSASSMPFITDHRWSHQPKSVYKAGACSTFSNSMFIATHSHQQQTNNRISLNKEASKKHFQSKNMVITRNPMGEQSTTEEQGERMPPMSGPSSVRQRPMLTPRPKRQSTQFPTLSSEFARLRTVLS